jgi:hypothetical protein
VTATQDVQMEMEHGLPRISAGVRDDSVAGLRQSLLLRNIRTGHEEPSQEVAVLITAILHCCHMRFGDDERMDRRLRVNIVEGQRVLVLVHDFGGNGFLDNFAK